MSTLSGSISTENDALETGRILSRPMNTPTWIESSSFLNTVDVQMTGGAAGEDRVQVVCSEGNGWLFCGVYDGFNGRDAADFLAGTLHENIGFYLHLLKWRTMQQAGSSKSSLEGSLKGNTVKSGLSNEFETSDAERKSTMLPHYLDEDFSCESFRLRAIDFLCRALAQAENDFMCMVE